MAKWFCLTQVARRIHFGSFPLIGRFVTSVTSTFGRSRYDVLLDLSGIPIPPTPRRSKRQPKDPAGASPLGGLFIPPGKILRRRLSASGAPFFRRRSQSGRSVGIRLGLRAAGERIELDLAKFQRSPCAPRPFGSMIARQIAAPTISGFGVGPFSLKQQR